MTAMTPAIAGIDFAAIFSTLPRPYVALAPNGRIIAVSDGFLHETMTRRDDVTGLRLAQVLPPNPDGPEPTVNIFQAAVDGVLATGQKRELRGLRYDIRRPEAFGGGYEERFWNICTQPFCDGTGEIDYVIQSLEDVTSPILKAMAAEDRFRSVEQSFEATFEQNAVGIAHIGLDGRFLRINNHFGDLLGYSHEAMLQRTIQSVTHPDDLEMTMAQVEALLKGPGFPYTLEKRYIRRDGTILWARVTRALVRDAARRPAYFVSVVEDISSRKAAEIALVQREAYLQSILDTVPAGMIVINDRGIIESFSRTAERLFGYSAEEILGQNIKVLMPPGDRERHDGYVSRYLETGAPRVIGIGRVVVGERKDGSTFSLNLSIGEISSAPRRQFIGFVQDLTERQAAEAHLRELQAELVHISRFTALGEMASTLAHELNQPLTAITNFLKGCRRLLSQGLEGNVSLLSDAVDQAAEQALRAGQIIRRLRAFVERGDSERTSENLPKLIDEASMLALVGAKELGVHVAFDLDPRAQFVFVDRIQIQQVLLNLIRNAIEAMQECPRRELVISTSSKPDGMVEVCVADSGIGLAPEVVANLFQPFITTKATGMGVGLSICRTIVEAHEGKIWATSDRACGTTFRFTLRAMKPEEAAHAG